VGSSTYNSPLTYKMFSNLKKHLLTIILIALVVTCITILCFVIQDINELYKHIDLLNLFYRNLGTGTNI
jgi:hypothetical protein